MKIMALATCYNRRDITLRALDALHGQLLPPDCSLDICLVDDGSTDGTSDAVRSAFPNVTILKGTGSLFWAGGMRYGWEYYVSQQEFDYLLVFNDDVKLYPNVVQKLLVTAEEVESTGCNAYAITGAFKTPDTGEVAYGGLKRSSYWHPLRFKKMYSTDTLHDCDTLNMNLALISKEALNRIGFLSEGFIHAKADYDYGLRLRATGGRVVLASGFVGECNINPKTGTSAEANLSFSERWRRLTSIKEQSPRERALFYRRHAGYFWPVFWLMPYLRVGVAGVLSSLLIAKKLAK